MDPKETINDILVNLFNEILKLEEEAVITDEFKDITNNDQRWRNGSGSRPGRSPLPSTAWSIKSM